MVTIIIFILYVTVKPEINYYSVKTILSGEVNNAMTCNILLAAVIEFKIIILVLHRMLVLKYTCSEEKSIYNHYIIVLYTTT